MKLRTASTVALCIGLVFGTLGITGIQAYAQGSQVTVYNPMGTPPPIQMKAMAPRLDTIEGKTIYLVDTGFPNSDMFMAAARDWFKENHPKTNTVIVTTGMSNIPAPILNELREKADAVFFGLGH